jgi:hypothetical protein
VERTAGGHRSPEQPGEVRVKVGREILDRGYGKSITPVVAKVTGGSKFDWDRVPTNKLRDVYDVLRLAQTESPVVEHEP